MTIGSRESSAQLRISQEDGQDPRIGPTPSLSFSCWSSSPIVRSARRSAANRKPRRDAPATGFSSIAVKWPPLGDLTRRSIPLETDRPTGATCRLCSRKSGITTPVTASRITLHLAHHAHLSPRRIVVSSPESSRASRDAIERPSGRGGGGEGTD